ncbi:MAG: DUF1566 domain-containing protein [Cellvibrionales bacterium]|nr:DUF1566 domain-containing protein [Cellvibrionales bacterium]
MKHSTPNVLMRLLSFVSVLLLIVWLVDYQHTPDLPKKSRFIKLNNQGQPMPQWQGPWACVLDTQTGNVWENKTDNESIHDALWTYSWYQDHTGVENSGDCYFEENRCDTEDLITRANQQALCDIKDWRLPTSNELFTLVNPKPKTGKPAIYNDYFPHTKRGDYWTSNHNIPMTGVYAHLKSGAMAIDFIDGMMKPLPYRNAAFVRLVSSTNKKPQH